MNPTPAKRVVIAEDEALIRLDLAEMLGEEGYEVVGEAADGLTAVKLTRELRPDIVMMDIKMPGLDGISAAAQIGAEELAAVVMLTAFSQRELIEKASQAGAMAYLIKPFTQRDLIPAIELALARFDQIKALSSEVDDLQERLETRKLVERAKEILADGLGLSEADAFRWMQKTAMDVRKSMAEVARTIIEQGSNLKS